MFVDLYYTNQIADSLVVLLFCYCINDKCTEANNLASNIHLYIKYS